MLANDQKAFKPINWPNKAVHKHKAPKGALGPRWIYLVMQSWLDTTVHLECWTSLSSSPTSFLENSMQIGRFNRDKETGMFNSKCFRNRIIQRNIYIYINSLTLKVLNWLTDKSKEWIACSKITHHTLTVPIMQVKGVRIVTQLIEFF